MFTLEFSTDNDTFVLGVADECARILKDVAKKVAKGQTGGNIADANGNSIGRWRLKE